LLVLPASAASETLKELEARFSKRFGGTTAISLRNTRTGEELLSIGGSQMMMPASCLKLLTSLAALRVLTGEYTFKTEFFLSSGESPVLTVRGHGDPDLTDENMWKIADDLARMGLGAVNGLILDSSLFVERRPRTGLNPYQAAQGALSVNYNSISVRAQLFRGKIHTTSTLFASNVVNPSFSPGRYGSISLAEDSAGVIQARGVAPNDGDPVEEYITVEDPEKLFGELLRGYLSSRGMKLKGDARTGQVSPSMKPAYVLESKNLAQLLIDLNHNSLNFVANQIVYALGRTPEGRYSFEKGLAVLRRVADEAGVPAAELQIEDGSGLSREDKTTARALTKIIAAAVRDPATAPDFLASLPRYGRRGTLKHRSLGLAGEDGIWAKTGSLDGVSSVAGTFPAGGDLVAFAIITNGSVSKSDAIEREDEFVRSAFKLLHGNRASGAITPPSDTHR